MAFTLARQIDNVIPTAEPASGQLAPAAGVASHDIGVNTLVRGGVIYVEHGAAFDAAPEKLHGHMDFLLEVYARSGAATVAPRKPFLRLECPIGVNGPQTWMFIVTAQDDKGNPIPWPRHTVWSIQNRTSAGVAANQLDVHFEYVEETS